MQTFTKFSVNFSRKDFHVSGNKSVSWFIIFDIENEYTKSIATVTHSLIIVLSALIVAKSIFVWTNFCNFSPKSKNLILQHYAIAKISTVSTYPFSTAFFLLSNPFSNSVFLHCRIKGNYQISLGDDKNFVPRRSLSGQF